MKLKIILCLTLLLLLTSPAFSKDPEWLKKIKQIALLTDTYDDVIRILGKPVDGSSEKELSEYFDFKEGRIFVGFESGKCIATPESNGKLVGWKVPRWTVTDISFSPNKWIDPKKLNINFNGFTAKPIYDVSEAVEYRNDELGIDYVLNKGKIEYITFRPAKKYNYLLCE